MAKGHFYKLKWQEQTLTFPVICWNILLLSVCYDMILKKCLVAFLHVSAVGKTGVGSNTRPFAPPLAIDAPVMNIDLKSESLKIKIRPIYV